MPGGADAQAGDEGAAADATTSEEVYETGTCHLLEILYVTSYTYTLLYASYCVAVIISIAFKFIHWFFQFLSIDCLVLCFFKTINRD